MTSKNLQQKSRKAFSHSPANKQEIGEFTNGYFVMPDPSLPTSTDTKTRTRRTKDEFSSPTKTHSKAKSFSPETSPVKTPQPSPQKSEKSTSPPSCKRWAGASFSNAPPPSSLPLPDFSSVVSSSQPTVAPIYATPPPLSLSAPHYYPSPAPHYTLQVVPPSPAAPVYQYPPSMLPVHPAVQPSLGQLSMDLRRLLNIGDTSVVVQAS